MRNFVLKMMNFVLKTMNVGGARSARAWWDVSVHKHSPPHLVFQGFF